MDTCHLICLYLSYCILMLFLNWKNREDSSIALGRIRLNLVTLFKVLPIMRG